MSRKKAEISAALKQCEAETRAAREKFEDTVDNATDDPKTGSER
jgi:F0F1-type ATP synthase membrane subunit b/b'